MNFFICKLSHWLRRFILASLVLFFAGSSLAIADAIPDNQYLIEATYNGTTGTSFSKVICPKSSDADRTILLKVSPGANFTDDVSLHKKLTSGMSMRISPSVLHSPYDSAATAIFKLNAKKAYYFLIEGPRSLEERHFVDFEIAQAGTVPVSVSPVNGGYVTTLTPTFTWMPVPDATSYTIEIASDHSFKKRFIVAKSIVTDTSYTIDTNLLDANTYYWRVKTTNGCGKKGTVTSLVHGFTVSLQ